MVKTYHKLVRDKIPQIIEQTGAACVTEELSREQYVRMLEEKLNEELAEYQDSKSMEELADLLEVMMALVQAKGHSWQQLEQIRQEKREARGGFDNRILLKQVTEAE